MSTSLDDPVAPLEERFRSAREEAEALAWYFARHGPGGSDAQASAAYAELVKVLSASEGDEKESNYEQLMISYQKLASYTFTAAEVHGKSILDTTRTAQSLRARLLDRRRLPVFLGLIFFGFALLFRTLDAWTKSVLSPRGSEAGSETTAADSTEYLCASLLASCIPLLIPVAWGALGACTALAKRVSDRLSAMSFEENRMQALTSRIFLGAALALVLNILVFIEGGTAEGDGASLGFGPIAGAFLAGLFVQHIYGALETLMRRVSRAISPVHPGSGPTPPSSPASNPPAASQ